ncbi:hypothetical protein MAM1_0008c00958 [Mucor ambiguus]|uniref:Helitron helicase-like domain-containing protein n=1 Tax=Mucor ambiguus TaxID=91626 RepID=A0A0C9LQJ8_9FUNG|nr:hypothetical protein MAM1_0008c00958 [Mucor ambiguus]
MINFGSDEVGLLIIGGENDSQETTSFKDIVIHHQHQPEMRFINEFTQHHDPLAYALIFPHGDAHWHIYMFRNETLSDDYLSPSSGPTIIASLNYFAISNASDAAATISAGSRGRKFSSMDYYCYGLMVREPFMHYLFMYGKRIYIIHQCLEHIHKFCVWSGQIVFC